MIRYLDISFPLTSIEKNVITVPFKIIYQTHSKALESKIADKYPDLITMAGYNAEQLKRLLVMKKEIQNGLTPADVDEIHNVFYEKYFLDPIQKTDNVTKIKLTAFDCKMWTDEEPYLEINGEISADIDEMFQKLYTRKKIIVKKDVKSFKQTVMLKLISHLPLIYIFDKPTFLFSFFFNNIFLKSIDKRGTFWNTKMRSQFKVKNFEKAEKSFEFIGFNQIKIKILDFGTNLMNKISNNKLETGVLAMMALGMVRNRHMFGEAATPEKTAVITYGRFNPVTRGHEKLFDVINTQATKTNGDMIVFASPSEGDAKNPIGFSTKIKLLKELIPRYAKSFNTKKFTSFIDILVYLYKMGYKNIVIVVGSDRIKSIKALANNYNGIRGKAHGFYKFNTIKVISSGSRDDDTISGTQMREWAMKNNIQKFKNGLPSGSTLKHAKYIMNMIREGSK